MKKIAVGDIVRHGYGNIHWPSATPIGVVTVVEGKHCRIRWLDHGLPRTRDIARVRNRRNDWWKWTGQRIQKVNLTEMPDPITLLGVLHEEAI